ncbi:molybdenum cofactor guanylyltransferase [Subtercola sp. YIM 133946]|uniref:molybdenum cofactor guanylyltransferase n=1 Tax=Subtercola sp. YIM 133946 TaxID=3118909 RepID=UPI002F957276
MNVGAIVLAGGRSARLGGVPKATLLFDGATLLQRTLDAVQDARRIVIVGTPPPGPLAPRYAPASAPVRVTVTREEPPFAGPAAAIAAGLDVLLAPPAPESLDLVIVLACDMPNAAPAVAALLAAVGGDHGSETDGVMAVDDDGSPQYLTAVYRTGALVEAVAAARRAGPLENLSARRLFGPLRVRQVPVPPGSTHDVDTPSDASAFGITLPSPTTPSGTPR